MSDHSSIEWTDATWNPVTGCTRVSPGCANCYIERTPPFRIEGRRFVNGTTGVRLHPDRLEQPMRWRKPRRVFVCSLADLFHEDVPEAFIFDVFEAMARAPQHTFQVLTKRPERAREILSDAGGHPTFLELLSHHSGGRWWPHVLPPHIWLGVSIENARHTWRADVLREIPAAVRFISAEPLLGSLVHPPADRIRRKRAAEPDGRGGLRRVAGTELYAEPLDLTGIDWLIVGGESGPGARPLKLEWARELVDACYAESDREGDSLRPAVFVKQLGARPVERFDGTATLRDRSTTNAYTLEPLKLRDRKGGDWTEWPADLRVREMPTVRA